MKAFCHVCHVNVKCGNRQRLLVCLSFHAELSGHCCEGQKHFMGLINFPQVCSNETDSTEIIRKNETLHTSNLFSGNC